MSRRSKPPIAVSQSIDMTASRWRFVTEYGSCVGCPVNPTPSVPYGDAWRFLLPRLEDRPDAKVGYLLCPHTAPITAASLSGTFRLITTDPVNLLDAKTPSDGVTPASFRFIIMTGLDSASMGNEFGRWWSREGITLDSLRAGAGALNVPLQPDAWSSVLGKTGTEAPAEFAAVLQAPQFIGITFGAGGDYGHGIVTTGGYATLTAEGIKLV